MSSVVPIPIGSMMRRKREAVTAGGRSCGTRERPKARAETSTFVTPTRKKGALSPRAESRNLNMYVTPIEATNQAQTASGTRSARNLSAGDVSGLPTASTPSSFGRSNLSPPTPSALSASLSLSPLSLSSRPATGVALGGWLSPPPRANPSPSSSCA
eukprot:scaffold138_cov30-Tisochrysis_lutea.AAC.4